MKSPKRKTHLKNFIKIAADNDRKSNAILDMSRLIQKVSEDEPFLKKQELKQKVCELAMQNNNLNDVEANKIYNAASNVVLPFLNSGEEIARANGQLDGLARVAKDHLFQPKYDKDGNHIDDVFDPKVMDSIVKAVKVKVDMTTKTQKNLIDAERLITEREQNSDNDLNLGIANREELERYLNYKLMENPELAERLIKKKNEQMQISKNSKFYAVVEEEK